MKEQNAGILALVVVSTVHVAAGATVGALHLHVFKCIFPVVPRGGRRKANWSGAVGLSARKTWWISSSKTKMAARLNNIEVCRVIFVAVIIVVSFGLRHATLVAKTRHKHTFQCHRYFTLLRKCRDKIFSKLVVDLRHNKRWKTAKQASTIFSVTLTTALKAQISAWLFNFRQNLH